MDLGQVGERELVRRIRARGLFRPDGVVRGIGDDAAVFRVEPGRVAVVTTDLLLDGVHFRLERSDPRTLGARAMIVNLSDLAAMGARPRESFLGLAAPRGLRAEALDLFLAGLEAEARRHGVNLLGGDTCESRGGLVVAITLFGDAEEGRLVYRSGARSGDRIYVTGTLGDSAGGLLLLERGCDLDHGDRRALVRAHELPRAFVAEGEWLSRSGAATAMIDLSDGCSIDLARVLEESGGLGATLDRAALPLAPELRAVAFELDVEPIDLALHGGEDYRLLVTVRPDAAAEVEAGFLMRFGERLHPIGVVESTPGMRLSEGAGTVPVAPRGFEHWS